MFLEPFPRGNDDGSAAALFDTVWWSIFRLFLGPSLCDANQFEEVGWDFVSVNEDLGIRAEASGVLFLGVLNTLGTASGFVEMSLATIRTRFGHNLFISGIRTGIHVTFPFVLSLGNSRSLFREKTLVRDLRQDQKERRRVIVFETRRTSGKAGIRGSS